MVKAVTPSVVNVYATTHRAAVEPRRSPAIRSSRASSAAAAVPEPAARSRSRSARASSSMRGVILTNRHVVDGATDIRIALSDGREYAGRCSCSMIRKTDLAVLQIDDPKGDDVPGACSFADSDDAAGRRPRARHRQSVRRRPDGDQRHRLGAGADRRRKLELRVLHPDRCGHQSGQFGRRAGRSRWPAGRHQYGDLFAIRRLGRHRLCHPGQHGASWWPRPASTAARSCGRGSARGCRRSPPISPTAWAWPRRTAR